MIFRMLYCYGCMPARDRKLGDQRQLSAPDSRNGRYVTETMVRHRADKGNTVIETGEVAERISVIGFPKWSRNGPCPNLQRILSAQILLRKYPKRCRFRLLVFPWSPTSLKHMLFKETPQRTELGYRAPPNSTIKSMNEIGPRPPSYLKEN